MEESDETKDSRDFQSGFPNMSGGAGWPSWNPVAGQIPQQPDPEMPTFPGGGGGGGGPGFVYPTLPPPGVGGGDGNGAPYPAYGFNPGILNPSHTQPIATPTQMKCPTPHCVNILSPPIYQCENGHAICNVCIERLDYCTEPTCMEPLEGPKIRNIVLEQQLFQRSGAGIRCPQDGCSVVLHSGEYLRGHLEVCRFRGSLFCSKYLGFSNCSERVTQSSLLPHLSEHHQIWNLDDQKVILKLVAPSHQLQRSSHHQGLVWTPIIMKINSEEDGFPHVLLKCFISPQNILNLSGHLLPHSDDLEWKKYRIKFQIESASQVSRLEWTGRMIFNEWKQTTHDDASCQPVTNLNTFRIPLSSLQEYLQPTKSIEDEEDSSKLKVRVSIWKYSEDHVSPFISPDWDEEPSQKRALLSKIPGQDETTFFVKAEDQLDDSSFRSVPRSHVKFQYGEEEFANYYPLDSSCRHCSRHLYGDIIYQCLQCPSEDQATYFCKNCIEHGNSHGEHLTVRISKPELQPLAAVAFECSAGELH